MNDDKIARRYLRSNARNDVRLSITDPCTSVMYGQELVIRGTITTGRHLLPVTCSQSRLRAGAELFDQSGRKVIAARGDFEGDIIGPGEAREFEVRVPTKRVSAGSYEIYVDLLFERIAWLKVGQRWRVIVQPEFELSTIDETISIDNVLFWKQHVPEFNSATGLRITSPTFQTYDIHNTSGTVQARSMLTSFEISLLYALARNHVSGFGEIADLGPLLGIGTNAMARGLSDNQNPAVRDVRIYSYDLFLFEGMGHFLPATDQNGTGSVFHRYLEINHDYFERVVPVPGDFMKMRWIGRPIEVLFIDLAKSWALNAKVLREFFPYLIPGRSIVVQQDYVHVGEPWIALTMERLAEYFELLYFVYGGTAVFRLKSAIPQSALDEDMRSLPDDVIRSLFERARSKVTPAIAQVLKCCEAAILIERGQAAEARAILDRIDLAATDSRYQSQDFAPAIVPNRAATLRWLERAERGQKVTLGVGP